MDASAVKRSLLLSAAASLSSHVKETSRSRVSPIFHPPPQYPIYDNLRLSGKSIRFPKISFLYSPIVKQRDKFWSYVTYCFLIGFLLLLPIVLSSRLACPCHMTWERSAKRRYTISQGQYDTNDLASEDSEKDKLAAETSLNVSTSLDGSESDGKAGFVSFYGRPQKTEDEVKPESQKNYSGFLWFAGPSILVASFILPAIYLRRVFSIIFEDSLLTDFLILFFTEALFYCGAAIFLLIIHHLNRQENPLQNYNQPSSSNLSQRISFVTTLVLNLMVPMVAMGFVWPWTGPAASAALSPYLVGVVVQFAFERYASRRKSPCLPVIPIIFKVYRLHQLNRAAQLVTALSFAVKGAEVTPHNLEISSSLGTLMNILQFLGVVFVWSLASYLMKFVPSTTRISH